MNTWCNKCVPKSTSRKVIIPPVGKTFISGIAEKYSDIYPE